MGITIKIDLGRINKKFGANASKVAEHAIANQAMLDMERFVPLRAGGLRASGHVSGSQIVYNTVYARAQFYGSSYNKHRSFSFSKYTTAGTGPRWDLKAKGLYGDKWANKAKEALGL